MSAEKTRSSPEGADGQRRRRARLLAFSALAALGVLAMLVAAVTWDLGRLARYEISPAQTQWIIGRPHKAPRRPVEGERVRPLGELPPRGREPVQVSHLAGQVDPRRPPEALLALGRSGSAELYVNGIGTRSAELAADAYLTSPGAAPMLFPIPPEFYHPGRNRYDLIVRDGRGRALTAPLYAGPVSVLRPVVERIGMWTAMARPTLSLLGAVAALLCAAAAGVRRPSLPFLAIAAAAAAVGARAYLGGPFHLEVFGAYWPAFDRVLLGATLLCLALIWMKESALSGLRAWLAVGCGVLIPGACFNLAFALTETEPNLSAMAATTGILASVAALVLSAATADRPQPSTALPALAGLTALVAIVVVTAFAAVWGSFEVLSGLWVFRLDVVYGVGALASLSAVAIAATLVLARAAATFASTQLDLARLVRRQRDEIETQSQALEQQMRRGAILEERQRLARDMHDGIGGQLISLIARVRARHIGIDQVERELVGGLAELRLVVDSLDATGESLAQQLAIFRSRVRPQVEAAGMTLVWRQDEDLEVTTDDPRWVLNVYRLLQEAISNAVSHAGGDRLEIVVERAGERGFRVEVADNGKGIDKGREGGGRGLSNMAFRARQLGGELEIGAGEDGRGTRIGLTIPLPETRAPTPGDDQSMGEMRPS